MRFASLGCLGVCLWFASADVVSAQDFWGGGCPPWRPCGPGNSWGGNPLFVQGIGGADFRPACAAHDACLANGYSRKECDRMLYDGMLSSCACSDHPLLCRHKARMYYLGSRLFGGLWYPGQ